MTFLVAGLAAGWPLACAQRLAPPDVDDLRAADTRDAWLEEAADAVVTDAGRLLRIADRIRVAGVPLCSGQTAPLLGIIVSQRLSSAPNPRPLAEVLFRRFDVDTRPTVTLVDPAAPAASAGIQSGDRLLRANGRRVRSEPHLLRALRGHPAEPPRLEIERDGQRQTLTLPATPACGFEVQLAQTDSLSSWRGTAHQALIGRGLMRFARNDDELAVLVAHELGHHILGARSSAYPDQELEADRLGLEMAQRAGFDVAVTPALYERLAIEKPWLVVHDPDRLDVEEPVHARLGQRIVAVRAWLADGFVPVR